MLTSTQNNHIEYNTQHYKYNPKRTASMTARSNITFGGHYGAKKYCRDGISWLISETSFFRDWPTLQFIKQYVERKLQHKSKIRIVSCGCSTGEETVSLSMLLDHVKDRVQILGIDLNKKSIKKAQSRQFTLERNKPSKTPNDFRNILLHYYYSAYRDSFLVFNYNGRLTRIQQQQQNLFKDFFQILEGKNSETPTLSGRIIGFISKLFSNSKSNPNIESKTAELRKGKANNCVFKVGNVVDINSLTQGKKSDVILFKNTLFHIVTERNSISKARLMKKNAEELAEKVLSKLKENLNEDGIICFGEKEYLQIPDYSVIRKTMRNLGFCPLNDSKRNANIWQLKA